MAEGREIAGAVEGRDPWPWRRVRNAEAHREHTRRTLPQSQWLGELDGLNFLNSCKQQGLKPRVLKVN